MITLRKVNNKKYIYTEFVLLILLSISQFFGVTGANLGIVLCIICLFCLLPEKKDTEALFIAMPAFNMFSYSLGKTSLFYLLIILYSVKYLWHKNFRVNKRKMIIFFLCCLFTITIQDVEVWVKWVLQFWLMILLFNDKNLDQNFENIIKYTSVSAVLSSIVGYVMQINGKSIYTRSYVYIQDAGSTTRFAGLIGDSVFYGQFIAVLIAANLTLAYRNKKYTMFAYIASAIMAAFVLLSFSKTAILLIAVEVTGYIVFLIARNSNNRKNIFKNILLIFGVWAVIMLLYQYVMTHTDNILIKGFLTRFSANDLWTGRTSIAETYFEWLSTDWKYWLSGMEYSQYTSGIQNGNLLITRAHNIYIETACLFGIIPAIILLVALVCYFYRLQIKYRVYMMSYLPLLVLAASGISLHGHFEWHYYFLCSITFACVHSDIRKRKEIRSNEINAIY